MSIGARRVLLVLRFQLPLLPLYFMPHSHSGLSTARVHRSKHIQSWRPVPPIPLHHHYHHHYHLQPHSLSLSQANTNTSRAALSPHKHTRTNIQARWKSIVQRRHRPMKNACTLACFIRNTHWDSIHISALKPHRNINYTGNVGGSVVGNGAEWEYGEARCHPNERVTVSCRSRCHITGLDCEIHFSLSVTEMLLSAVVEL